MLYYLPIFRKVLHNLQIVCQTPLNFFIFTAGIPLLEENEMETEGSNSSEPGDTGSATYSETSNKA